MSGPITRARLLELFDRLGPAAIEGASPRARRGDGEAGAARERTFRGRLRVAGRSPHGPPRRPRCCRTLPIRLVDL